jgi:uncharacterized membrane protein
MWMYIAFATFYTIMGVCDFAHSQMHELTDDCVCVLFFTMLAIYQQIVNEGEDERRHLKETLRQQDEEVARANAAMNRAVAALKDINNTLDSCTDERS